MKRYSKNIVVLGGGESGYGTAVLAKKVGYNVFLSDNGRLQQKYIDILNEYSVEFEQGGHTYEKILSADVIVKSPGIPDSVEIVKLARDKGIAIISEMEFAKPFSKGKVISITGSNGKTTTTSLVYKILKDAKFNVGLGGNIGKSYALQVATDDKDWYVLELSSFQLDGMFSFKSDISILANITPDHLDRYDYKMENYVASKFRVCQNQSDSEYFIYNRDDVESMKYLSVNRVCANMLPFSLTLDSANCVLNGSEIEIKFEDKTFSIDRDKLQLKGLHNVMNVMAAALASCVAGVDSDTIVASVEDFGGVEHRLEVICHHNDILYINDSKATNVDAAWYALEGMDRSIVWIAGGKDKGNDYAPLFEIAKEKVHTLICMGVDNSKLVDKFTGVIPQIYSVDSLEGAIQLVSSCAKSGDVVLLSPACASFDLFNSYEHRGELFKEAILQLVKSL